MTSMLSCRSCASSTRFLSGLLFVAAVLACGAQRSAQSSAFAQEAGPKAFDPERRRGMVADVGGQPITYLDLERELRRYGIPKEEYPVYSGEVLSTLVNRKLLDLKADRLGIDVTEDQVQRLLERRFENARKKGEVYESIESFIVAEYRRTGDSERELRERIRLEHRRLRLLHEQAYEQVYISPSELRAYYEEHQAEFRTDTNHKVRFLVLSREPQPEQSERAKALTADLAAGKSFEEIAKKYSRGDLPELEAITDSDLDQYVAPIPSVIRSLEPGSMSPLVEMRTNTTIIFLESRELGSEQPFASAKTQSEIRQKLQTLLRERQYRNFIAQLRREFPVATFLD